MANLADENFARSVDNKLRRLAMTFSSRVIYGVEESSLGRHPTVAEMPDLLRALAKEIESRRV